MPTTESPQLGKYDLEPNPANVPAEFRRRNVLIERIALDQGRPADCLNDEAVDFIPACGQTVAWEPNFDDDKVSI